VDFKRLELIIIVEVKLQSFHFQWEGHISIAIGRARLCHGPFSLTKAPPPNFKTLIFLYF
jgi:hypothetical protein